MYDEDNINSGGLIIRLIDVVLIILLGFLNISDFVLKAQIKLDSGKSTETPEEIKTQIYFVNVLSDASIEIQDQEKINTLFISNENNNALYELENFLVNKFRRCQSAQVDMIVVLSSDPDTKIQYTIDILDICEKHKIPRSISY